MTTKNELTCQICGDQINFKNVVYCNDCGTAHHDDCWKYNGQCSTFGCGCKYSTDYPSSKITEKTCDTSYLNSPDTMTIDDTQDATSTVENKRKIRYGIKIISEKEEGSYIPVPMMEKAGFFSRYVEDYFYEDTDFSAPYIRVESASFKSYIVAAVCIIAFATIAIILHFFPTLPQVTFLGPVLKYIPPFAIFFAGIGLISNYSYTLDRPNKRLLCYHSRLNSEKIYKVNSFNELLATGVFVLHIRDKRYHYIPVLKLSNNTSIICNSQSTSQYYRACNFANNLAKTIDIPFIPPEPTISSFFTKSANPALVEIDVRLYEYSKWRRWHQTIEKRYLEKFILILSIGTAVVAMII